MGRMGGRTTAWPFVACVGLVVVAYARALRGGFVWDDPHLILRDARLRSWASLGDVVTQPFWAGSPLHVNDFYGAVYRPVVSFAYLVQMQLFGDDPFGYHVVNLVLQVACTVLAIRWFARRLRNPPPLALFVGGMIVAVHPSRVEAVAWISGCVDLWMLLWVLLALEAWDAKRGWVAGLCSSLALLSKEAAVVLPVLLAADQWLLRQERTKQQWVGIALPLAATLGFRASLAPVGFANRIILEELPERVLSTLGLFVQRTLLPWPQTVHPALRTYDAAGNELFPVGLWVLGGAFALGLVALFVVVVRGSKSVRPWLADLLWYVVPLLPVLNVVDIDTIARASDRFLVLPLLGAAALCARGVTSLVNRGRAETRALGAAAAAVAAIFVLMSALHASHFENDFVLWSHEYEVDPTNTEALWALSGIAEFQGLTSTAHRLCTEGFAAADQRRYQWTSIRFALCQLETGLELATDDPESVQYIRDVYDELMAKSLLTADRGSLEFDIHVRSEILRDRLMADPTQVVLPRAKAYLLSGEPEAAAVQLERITRSYPRNTEAWAMLIAAYRQVGNEARADATVAHARRLFGDWPAPSRR